MLTTSSVYRSAATIGAVRLRASIPQNTPIDPNILARTDALLRKQKCREFLNGLLAELGKRTGRGREGVSFEDLFKSIRGSIYSSPDLNSRGNAGQKLIGQH
jgi:hypothetical protein